MQSASEETFRFTALEHACRVTQSPDPKKIIDAAEQFLSFLKGEQPKKPELKEAA